MTEQSATPAGKGRFDGLDLARFLAFVGMVVVNFRVMMGAETGVGALSSFVGALEGRAAATFVILAGIGLGLAGSRRVDQAFAVTIRRAVFLLVLGLINTLVFEADIIHYYAFYFFFGAFLLRLDSRLLFLAIILVNVVFLVMLVTLDYNRSWDWVNLTYADFWTLDGFVRNLFFNGWHPVFPWIGFLLYGMILSRLSLGEIATQRNLVIFGAVLLAIAEGASAAITPKLHSMDPLLAPLGSTSSLPPLPLYTLAGIGAASMAIGICLAVAEMAKRLGILRLVVPAGRQTLTLYFAHVFVGVVMMEELGSLVDQELSVAVIAALAFCTISAVYAFFWSEKFNRGPLEELMRRFSG